MCFSPTASFTAAVGLGAIGILTLSKVKKKKEIPFASIPLLFGTQQAIEGIVWLSLKYNNVALNSAASYFFVFFAYIFWPIFVPIAVFLLEKVEWKKKLLYTLGLCGAVLGAFFAYFLVTHNITGHISNHCITYTIPRYDVFQIMALYVAATCLSLLISSDRVLMWFGVVATLSLAIAYEFYIFALVSVWCFFAAILSTIIYFYFRRRRARGLE
jgi:hypothetical protein